MTPDLQKTGRQWRMIRFNPLRSLTPARLASALDSSAAGWLREAALIYEAIETREAIVRSVMTKRRASVSRRDWQIIIPDADDPRGEAHKETLQYFYNNLTVTDAADMNVRSGMSGLLRQMMDAIIQKYAVHEIVWRPSRDGLTAQLRRVPLYFFENRSGKLRYTGPETRVDGMPLEDGGWMVTTAEGLGEALSLCYMYKRLSVQDWLAFSEKFSVPGVLGRTSAKSGSPEGNAMRDSVLAYASEWQGVIYGDDNTIPKPLEIIQTAGGDNLPQQLLAQYMDKMISCLVRGGDLSTVSKQDSTGASLQQGETDTLIQDDCAMVSETLQTQLDRLVIRMVHGDDTPAAYIRVNPPGEQDLARDMAIDTGLVALGVKQSPAALAERYGRTLARSLANRPQVLANRRDEIRPPDWIIRCIPKTKPAANRKDSAAPELLTGPALGLPPAGNSPPPPTP
jgi:phage gp29-like protein